jgi:hypothetical protein
VVLDLNLRGWYEQLGGQISANMQIIAFYVKLEASLFIALLAEVGEKDAGRDGDCFVTFSGVSEQLFAAYLGEGL